MAGHHRGTETSIRQALLFDYNHVDLDKQRLDPPQENMWRDWSDAINAADASLSSEFLAARGSLGERLVVSIHQCTTRDCTTSAHRVYLFMRGSWSGTLSKRCRPRTIGLL